MSGWGYRGQNQYNQYGNSSNPVRRSLPVVYTDGACTNNGRSGASGGYGVYWGSNHPNNVSAPLPGGPQTNNRAEYHAVDHALSQARAEGYDRVTVRTDSDLLIRSATQYANVWERNGWRTADGGAVKNQPELESIRDHMRHIDVKFEHVPGHSGIPGNEEANRLARDGAQRNRTYY